MITKRLPFILIICSFFLHSCLDATESDYEKQVREADEMIEAYLTENDIDAEKTTSGVHYEILEENENGKQVVEDHVVGILYKMTHLEGEYLVEEHTDASNPLRFSNSYNASYNTVYPVGLNYEINKMKQGEKYRFYIPSYQAFDNYSHEDLFDSYSHFILEVDLVEVKTEEEIYEVELDSIQTYINESNLEAESYPNGLYYVQTEAGEGAQPSGSSEVEFHFTRKYLDGSVIESTTDDDPISVFMNNNQLVPGLEEGLLLMQEGEKAELIMPSKLAFGKSIQVIPQQLREYWVENDDIDPKTKPYSPVIYEVELISVN